jgi:hypothetical protein
MVENPPVLDFISERHTMQAKCVLLLFPALTLSSALLACGADDDGGDESGEPSVPGTTPLSEIDTDEEAQVVCKRLAQAITAEESEALQGGGCALQGWFEAQSGGDCEQVKEACIAASSEAVGDPEACTTDDVPNCDLTVDQYVECLDAGSGVLANFTCTSTALQLAAFTSLPAHCQTGLQACSGMMP